MVRDWWDHKHHDGAVNALVIDRVPAAMICSIMARLRINAA